MSDHHFFEIKTPSTSDKIRLKFRLLPHGNHDAKNCNIRTDAVTEQFPLIGFILAHASIHAKGLTCMDITIASLQALGFNREVYLKAPPGWDSSPHVYCKLLKLAYVLVDASRLWKRTIEDCLCQLGFVNIPGLPQVFSFPKGSHLNGVMLAKVVEDFLITSDDEDVQSFLSQL